MERWSIGGLGEPRISDSRSCHLVVPAEPDFVLEEPDSTFGGYLEEWGSFGEAGWKCRAKRCFAYPATLKI